MSRQPRDIFFKPITMKQALLFLTTLIVLTSCSSKTKRVGILCKGEATVNTETNTITTTDGSGHQEKTVDFTGEKVTLQLNTPAGQTSLDLTENGYYILNAKSDTVIGSYQRYSDPKDAQQSISQETLKLKIDSLVQLSEGKNVTAANKNFYILPNQSVKISDNLNSIVVGPYHKMTSAETIDGKVPEVYRFYSIKEIRETITKLQKLQPPPQ